MFVVILSATFCVLTRVYLIIFDRHLFRQENGDFHKNFFLNSCLPFFLAMSITFFYGIRDSYFLEYLFLPGVILSGLSGQLTGYVFSSSYVKMPVKNTVIASKSTDLFIPLLLTVITQKFDLFEYVFSCFSVLIFVPLLFPLKKIASGFHYKWMLAIVSALLIQAGVNSYFSIYRLAESNVQFISLMACILFWRAVVSLHLPLSQLYNKKKASNSTSKDPVNYVLLLIRAIISLISQGAFYYSITRVSGNLAWPILNIAPLAACFSAHLVLKEETGKSEILTLAGLSIFIFFYTTSVV